MMFLLFFLLAGTIQYSNQQSSSETLVSEGNGEKRIACYITNWAQRREGKYKFTPDQVDPFLCTHLMYAFAKISSDEPVIAPTDEEIDIDQGGYESFTKLKLKNKNLKTMLSVGGWAEGPARFSTLTADNQERREFINNTIRFLRRFNFDGIDIDWQYPNDKSRKGSSINDRSNYVLLIKEMKEAFKEEARATGKPSLILSMVLPSKLQIVDDGYDIPILNRYVDHFNMNGYDYSLASDATLNHHSPLYPNQDEVEDDPFGSTLNVDYSIRTLLKRGVTPSKLNLGIPTYGRFFQLDDPNETNIGDPAGGASNSRGETGVKLYYEICMDIKQEGWKVEYMEMSSEEGPFGPYAFNTANWVCYDDPLSTKTKGLYAAKMELGGLMFWTIDDDDFTGDCGGGKFPVIKAGKESINSARINEMKGKRVNQEMSSRRSVPRKVNSSTKANEPITSENNRVVSVKAPAKESLPNTPNLDRPSEINLPTKISLPSIASPDQFFFLDKGRGSNIDNTLPISQSLPSRGNTPQLFAILFPNNVFFQDKILLSFNMNVDSKENSNSKS